MAPADGLPATPIFIGAVNKAPHPEAAKLFVDWALSKRGQDVYQNQKILLYGSLRTDAGPMPTGKRLADFKLLFPTDWDDYVGEPPGVREGVERDHGAVAATHAWPSIERARPWRPGPRLVSLVVGGGAAVLVLYPIAYLIQASLSVGDPQARPPEAYGLDNFTGLGRYAHIFGNTLLVAGVATVMAVVVGFAMAWILSRTNVPGPRGLRAAHGAAVLRDAADGRARVGADRLGRAAASSTRSGARSAARATSSTSTRRGASPG